MISVFVKKPEAGPEAIFAGDQVGDTNHYYNAYVNYTSSQNIVHRPPIQRPFSSVSDSALSGLRLKGMKMATQGQGHQRTRSRGVSASPKWSAERSYSVIQDSTDSQDYSPSWHIQPLFPDISTEKKSREHPQRLAKILKRDSWTENLLKKQSKIEQEYKGIRDFTRTKNTSAKNLSNQTITYKPPRGYTNFVTGKPLIYQDRPPSGRERAHRRFMEKLEAQNRMLQDLSDSDDDDDEEAKLRQGVLKIPSCSDMDVCIHGSCNGVSLQLAMDGLRIANDIERGLSTEPTQENQATHKPGYPIRDQEKDRNNTWSNKANESRVNTDQDKANTLTGHSSLITTGSSSTKPGKKYQMDKRTPPEIPTHITGESNNTQGTNYNHPDGANKLYEWSSFTATI